MGGEAKTAENERLERFEHGGQVVGVAHRDGVGDERTDRADDRVEIERREIPDLFTGLAKVSVEVGVEAGESLLAFDALSHGVCSDRVTSIRHTRAPSANAAR